MGKQKEKVSDNNPLIVVNRCLKNIIRLNNDRFVKKILDTQMKASKHIYNQALYCYRLWFNTIYSTFIQNRIKDIDLYLIHFSTRDKLILFEICIWMNDINSL